jgi:beta,beta-carotene 9',10'-dioxygenase
VVKAVFITNVNVTRIGRRFISMTETPLPVEFDPQTVKTVGVLDGGGDRVSGHLTTAHPHYDFIRMQAINFITRFSRKRTYYIYGIPSGTTEKKLIGSIQGDAAS